MRRSGQLAVWIVALSLASWAWPGGYEGSFHRTLNVNGPVHLTVETGSGGIKVSRRAGNTVQIDAVIHSKYEENVHAIEQNPPIRQDGNTIEIGHLPQELSHNTSVSYEVLVPESTDLNARSGSGDVEVFGVAGPVRAATGSGGIRVEDTPGELTATTGSGDLNVLDIGGRAELQTGSGTIRVRNVGADVRAGTGSGDITLDGTKAAVEAHTGSGTVHIDHAVSGVHVHTGSGDITAAGEMPRGSRWDLETGSGTIEIHLPSSAAAEVHAHTSSGTISSSHTMTTSGALNRHEFNGVMNRPDAMLTLRTGSGDIRID
jgi:DUF4097 and DUF4098 domain-containing protein YvlB